MQYLAATQPTASWLLTNPGYLTSLHADLFQATSDGRLAGLMLDVGGLRVVGSDDSRILALWHTDYITGTGDEAWGILRLQEPFGLWSQPGLSREVFERFL